MKCDKGHELTKIQDLDNRGNPINMGWCCETCEKVIEMGLK